jgi:tetratricopeptide (TPR) repeat protein
VLRRRPSPFLPLLLVAACSTPGGGATPERPAPQVPRVADWAASTRFRTALAPGVPDEPRWRAAAIRWREALRQSATFALDESGDNGVALLELAIDPVTHALAATWRDGATTRALAGGRWDGDDVAAGIDELAWAARLALGEAAAPPVPIAAGTSAVDDVVRAVDDALALTRDGGFNAAQRILLDARRRDGAAPFVLDGLAVLALLRGDAAQAERIAREALGYEARLLPATRHRIARTLLLARASLGGDAAAARDRELLQLGEVGAQERPFDPEPLLSQAIALDFLGEFARAKPLLQDLAQRLPQQPIVVYHAGWACLGAGDALAAARWFERAAARLPAGFVLLPRAIALYESGQHDALRELLAEVLTDAQEQGAPLALDTLRMQAAHALLRGDTAAARDRIVATLTWLLQHPQQLLQRAGELGEQGALLVRLGGGNELPPIVAAVQQQHQGVEVADVCAFLGGMVEVARRGERLPDVETRLAHGGDSAFSALLAAFAHERRGEIADMQAELARAARLHDTPMTKTLLARGLAATGRGAEAEHLLATLRAELKTIALRTRCRHPLLGPELAFAFVGG